MNELIIDEKLWLHAGKTGHTADWYVGGALYDKYENRMCCLGIASLACGVSQSHLRNKAYPSDLGKADQKKVRVVFPWMWADDWHSQAASELATINDLNDYTLAQRRSRIKAVFAKHGTKVVFVK